MRSPLYYKKCECNQIMTSRRRRGYYGWTGNPSTGGCHWVTEDMDDRHIEHYCPQCKITTHEKTDCEWRPFGDELELGISNDR